MGLGVSAVGRDEARVFCVLVLVLMCWWLVVRAELRRLRLRKQRVYDLTVRVLRVAGGNERVFNEVVDV